MTVALVPPVPPAPTRLERALGNLIGLGILYPERFGGEVFSAVPKEAVAATGEMLRLALELFIEDATKYGAADSSRIIAAANGSAKSLRGFLTDLVADATPDEPEAVLFEVAAALDEIAAQAEVTAPAPVASVTEPEPEEDEDVDPRRVQLFGDITPDKIIPPTGFLRDYVDYWKEQTDAPSLFHLMLAYVTLAAVVGGRVYFMLAGDNLYPNLWVVIIGKSGDGRKSTSLNKSKGCVWAIDPKAIFPPDFTTEALLDLLAANPQGVFYHSEFRSLYGMLSKDYMSGAKALLTELYDSPLEYRRETKGKSVIIHQPVISMASATTTQWLKSRNAEDDFGGGFLARYLFVPVFKRERSLALPPDPDPKRFSGLVRFLQKIRDAYATTVEARYTPAAKAMFIEWYGQFDALAPFADTPLAPFHARYQSAVHKISMLYTISVGGNVRAMDIDAVTYATATIEYITKSLLSLYDKHLTFGKSDEAIKKVMDLIPEKKGVIRSGLLRQSRMKVKEFDEVIATLIETERVTVEPSIKSGGRQGLVYKRKVGK